MDIAADGLLSATLSKPQSAGTVESALGRPYIKIKIKANTASGADSGRAYFVEKFTATQAFHEHIGRETLSAFLNECVGKVFLNCVIRTDTSEVSYYTNPSGKVMCHRRNVLLSAPNNADANTSISFNNRDNKHHILPEGTPVPFLVRLGVMTDAGKVVQSKYDKFKQINRFLEYVRDAVNSMGIGVAGDGEAAKDGDSEAATGSSEMVAGGGGAASPLRVVDFGCGKAYLTFAIHYYLMEVLGLAADIVGLDLKADVVEYCNNVATELNCRGLHFRVGYIADYCGESPDLVVALHACDTATDEALAFAVRSGARAILSAPCCQHEVNKQLGEGGKAAELTATTDVGETSPFAPLLRYGLLRERFAALVTDALRAEYLEAAGYNVQLLEFVDMEHTPKNLLIRAVKRRRSTGKDEGNGNLHGDAAMMDKTVQSVRAEALALSGALGVKITLGKMIGGLA